MQGGFPRGSPLHVPPLAEVTRHRVPQQSDVVELPNCGKKKWVKREGGVEVRKSRNSEEREKRDLH